MDYTEKENNRKASYMHHLQKKKQSVDSLLLFAFAGLSRDLWDTLTPRR